MNSIQAAPIKILAGKGWRVFLTIGTERFESRSVFETEADAERVAEYVMEVLAEGAAE